MKILNFKKLQDNIFGANLWTQAKRANVTAEELSMLKGQIKKYRKEFGEDYDGLSNTYGIYYFENDHQVPYCTELTFETLLSNARDEIEAKRKAEEEAKKSMTLSEMFEAGESISIQAGQPTWKSCKGLNSLSAIGEAMDAPIYEDTAFKKGWFFQLKVPFSKIGRDAIINDVFCTQKMKDQITKGTEVFYEGYLKEEDGKIFSYCNTVRPVPLDTPLFD